MLSTFLKMRESKYFFRPPKLNKEKNIPDFHTHSNNRSRGPCMDSHSQDTSHLDTFDRDTFDRDTSGLETDCFD